MQKVIFLTLIVVTTFVTSCTNQSSSIDGLIPKNAVSLIKNSTQVINNKNIECVELPIVVGGKEKIIRFNLEVRRDIIAEKILQIALYPNKEVKLSFVYKDNIALIIM